MSTNDKWTITDVIGVTAFFALIIAVVVGFVFGLFALSNHRDMVKRVDPVCDYLHAERQGNVCVKDGSVVYDDDKR